MMAIFFTFDDDFLYPKNYVANMIDTIERFNRKALITVHGSIFAPDVDWYYERSRAYGIRQPLYEFKFVQLPGSATVAFHTSTLHIKYEDFPREPMVDLKFAIIAMEQNIPIIAIPRPQGWVKFLELEGLWQEYNGKITHHTPATIAAAPWSFDRFRDIYKPFIDQLDKKSYAWLDSEVLDCLESGVPDSWNETRQAKNSRNRHIELVQEINNTHRIQRYLKSQARKVKRYILLLLKIIKVIIRKYF